MRWCVYDEDNCCYAVVEADWFVALEHGVLFGIYEIEHDRKNTHYLRAQGIMKVIPEEEIKHENSMA